MLQRFSLYLISMSLLTFLSISAVTQSSEKKIVYGLLLDNTRSLEKQFPQVLLLGKGVIKRIHHRGPVSLFSFIPKRYEGSYDLYGDVEAREGRGVATATLGVEWSQDADILERYVETLKVEGGQTVLFEAIRSVASEIKAKADSDKESFDSKVLILITDGYHKVMWRGRFFYDQGDEERNVQQKELIKELKESGVKVYAIGLVRELDAYGGNVMTQKERAESFLRKITRETGGRAVFPKSKTINIDRLLEELLAQ